MLIIKFFVFLCSLTNEEEQLVPVENLGMCSVYIDHEAYKKNSHKQLALNLYITAMCRNALAPLCRLFGDKEEADRIEAYGNRILQGCIRKFWDEERKVYVNNLPWIKEEGEIRYCDRSLSTALIYDLCPGNSIDKSLEILEQTPAELGISYPCNAVWCLWALVKYRKIESVLSDLRTKWGRMSSVWENNTLQEFWTAYPDEGSQWSHCAMHPLIALSQGIAGIYPIEGGSGKIKIEPQPGSLEKVDFDVYTAKGAVHFYSQGKKGKRTLRLRIPDTVSVELWLDAREEIKLPFLRTEKNGIKVYKMEGLEKYELHLKYT